jgi:PIN domain nuclease of toxin-antitoxin system
MRVLLDTHVLLWFLGAPHRLDEATRAMLVDPSTDVLFSVASVWEIAIKASLGREDFGVRPAEIAGAALRVGFAELPIWSRAAALVADLPLHHRDPFDRLLIAQALSEPARLLTADAQLRPYSELVTLVR